MNTPAQKQLVEFLKNSEKILIFTGAGVSTGSGIPDYRGPKGVWKRRQPVYYQDFMSSESARLEYWDFQLEGYEQFKDAKPNSIHLACVELEQAGKLCLLVTQNIDGLHSKAGMSDGKLVEIHGTNRVIECQSCHKKSEPKEAMEYFKKTKKSPVCKCGGFLKPATISFGQSLIEGDLQRSARAAAECDLAISLGSSLSVHPAASVPLTAAQRGVSYVIINQGPTDQDDLPMVSLRLEGDVADIFPRAVEEVLDA